MKVTICALHGCALVSPDVGVEALASCARVAAEHRRKRTRPATVGSLSRFAASPRSILENRAAVHAVTTVEARGRG